MSALCGVPDCYIEVTHVHRVGGWAISNHSILGRLAYPVMHERQLYVYPRGPGDAPGNQWVCSCGRIWPCALITHDAQDSIAAAKAHPAAHSNAEWGTLAPPWPCHDDDGVWYCDAHRTYDCRVCATTLPDAPEQIACSCHSDCACASCVEERARFRDTLDSKEQKTGVNNLADLMLDLTAENVALREEVERLSEHAAPDAEPTQEQKYEEVGMALAASLLREAALRAEVERLSEHAAPDAEPTREQIAGEYPTMGDLVRALRAEVERLSEHADTMAIRAEAAESAAYKAEAELARERAENERLSQCLAYERDEYAQYREAHPHSRLKMEEALEKWATKLEEYVGYSSTVTRIVGEMRTRSAPGEP